MMRTSLFLIFVFYTLQFRAQELTSSLNTVLNAESVRDNAWEIGFHAGHFFTAGNVEFIPGYAGGIHLRRALDYVFSLRADVVYGSAKGEDPGNVRNFENKWFSGSLQTLVSLNNLKWSPGERKSNFFLLLGLGLNTFSVESQEGEKKGNVEGDLAVHSDIGAGLSFKISSRVNLGFEHKASIVFGKRSDLPDGFQTRTLDQDNRGTFRDVLHLTGLRLNYNFGKREDQQAEPLYWLNPLEAVFSDLRQLMEFKNEMTDGDGDGVPDKYDLEKNTLPNVLVNSRGQTLDSDNDGIPDYLDREPFSPPGYQIDAFGVARRPDILAEASREVETKIQTLRQEIPPPPTVTMLDDASIINMMLPAIYFSVGSSNIGGKDLIHLETVGNLMKKHPQIRLVVTGHSDKVGKDAFNQDLSYWRAKKVIDQLVSAYGISRQRLILQYKGSRECPVEGAHEANRRVHFKVATTETEMPPPR